MHLVHLSPKCTAEQWILTKAGRQLPFVSNFQTKSSEKKRCQNNLAYLIGSWHLCNPNWRIRMLFFTTKRQCGESSQTNISPMGSLSEGVGFYQLDGLPPHSSLKGQLTTTLFCYSFILTIYFYSFIDSFISSLFFFSFIYQWGGRVLETGWELTPFPWDVYLCVRSLAASLGETGLSDSLDSLSYRSVPSPLSRFSSGNTHTPPFKRRVWNWKQIASLIK